MSPPHRDVLFPRAQASDVCLCSYLHLLGFLVTEALFMSVLGLAEDEPGRGWVLSCHRLHVEQLTRVCSSTHQCSPPPSARGVCMCRKCFSMTLLGTDAFNFGDCTEPGHGNVTGCRCCCSFWGCCRSLNTFSFQHCDLSL